MGLVLTRDIFCDGILESGNLCPQWAEGASSIDSAAAARELARHAGWVRRDGRDLCPECAKAGR